MFQSTNYQLTTLAETAKVIQELEERKNSSSESQGLTSSATSSENEEQTNNSLKNSKKLGMPRLLTILGRQNISNEDINTIANLQKLNKEIKKNFLDLSHLLNEK